MAGSWQLVASSTFLNRVILFLKLDKEFNISKSISLSENGETLILEWKGDHGRALSPQKLRAAAGSANEGLCIEH